MIWQIKYTYSQSTLLLFSNVMNSHFALHFMNEKKHKKTQEIEKKNNLHSSTRSHCVFIVIIIININIIVIVVIIIIKCIRIQSVICGCKNKIRSFHFSHFFHPVLLSSIWAQLKNSSKNQLIKFRLRRALSYRHQIRMLSIHVSWGLFFFFSYSSSIRLIDRSIVRLHILLRDVFACFLCVIDVERRQCNV